MNNSRPGPDTGADPGPGAGAGVVEADSQKETRRGDRIDRPE